jgi:hypothetical protein
MFKRLILLLAVFVAGAYAAANHEVEGARGLGTAVDAANRAANFGFDVRRVTFGGHTRLGGSFNFAMGDRVHHQGLRIQSPHITQLTVDGSAAEFAGPAELVRITPLGIQTVRGRVEVTVIDRRNHAHPHGEPDVLSVVFKNQHGDTLFHYTGLVMRGDIDVYSGP